MIDNSRFVVYKALVAVTIAALIGIPLVSQAAHPKPAPAFAYDLAMPLIWLAGYVADFRRRRTRFLLEEACQSARMGQDAGAEAILGRVDMRRLPPKDRKPFLPTLGALALRRGRPLEARAHLYEALSLGVASLPEAAEVRLLLARAELALGDTAAAAEHLRVARGLPRPPRLAAELRAAEAALGG